MVTDPIHENATGSYLSGTIFRVMLNPENGRRERHRMEKRLAFPGSYYDTRRFEAWLSRHAAEGRRFCEFTSHGKMTVFEPEEPRRVQYYVEPDFGQYTAEEKEKAYADLGWIFVEELQGTCLVYKSDDLLALRPVRRFEEKDLSKKWRKLLWSQLASILLAPLSVFLVLKSFPDHSVMLGEHWALIAALVLFSSLYIIFQLWPLAASLYDVRVWNRSVRMGEEIDEWRGMILLRWGEVILLWLVLATIPILWILYMLLT